MLGQKIPCNFPSPEEVCVSTLMELPLTLLKHKLGFGDIAQLAKKTFCNWDTRDHIAGTFVCTAQRTNDSGD